MLFKKWNTTCLSFEEDPEPFSRVRDKNITEMCKELNIEVISAVSHTLYKLEKYENLLGQKIIFASTNRCNSRIIEKNNGKAPLTYHQFQAIIASMEPPPPAEATITDETIGTARTPVHEDHDDKYGVPTLEELGFDTEGLRPPVWLGGETEALGKLSCNSFVKS